MALAARGCGIKPSGLAAGTNGLDIEFKSGKPHKASRGIPAGGTKKDGSIVRVDLHLIIPAFRASALFVLRDVHKLSLVDVGELKRACHAFLCAKSGMPIAARKDSMSSLHGGSMVKAP